MFNYLKNSFRRKIARRFTRKYPVKIDTFQVEGIGEIRFANWKNPLVEDKHISRDNLDFFRGILNEGDLALDIGANIGLMTVQMGLITGKKGLTVGFDPNPYVYEILKQNHSLNADKAGIAVYNYAISDEDGEFYYNSSEASFNNGGISQDTESRHGKYSLQHKVKGVNLRRFLETEHSELLDHLKLVKIDTEGYDKEIIRSVTGLLTQYKPIVITECFGKNDEAARTEQFNLLHSIGYTLYHLPDFKKGVHKTEIKTAADMMKWKHFDIYAVMES